ncbi:hypothetical protein [Parvularcula dongshanensis]|uniref:Uncharacterized protein n=1 Tax=Parvularcula dongshanensis TaxID=1173995 RepID=A0A840I7V3_9PROT|nr:hypothetical protein [Parvularcula dongshanensis]MBB4660343.1 hypothetical protein [Parvularcula dongshanensis]
MAARYLTRIWEHATRPSLRFIDALGFTVPPIAQAFFQLSGADMPDQIAQLIPVYIALAFGGVVLVRILSAPYQIWRVDQQRIAQLEQELTAPERIRTTALRERMAIREAKIRESIVDELKRFRRESTAYKTMPPLEIIEGTQEYSSLMRELAVTLPEAEYFYHAVVEMMFELQRVPIRSATQIREEGFTVDQRYTSYRALIDHVVSFAKTGDYSVEFLRELPYCTSPDRQDFAPLFANNDSRTANSR